MKSNLPDIYEIVKKHFTDHLENKKLRKTPERFFILKEIYKMNEHFNIETLSLKLAENNFIVSKATIYNTLDLLLECKLVNRIQFKLTGKMYEKSFYFKQHDHILVIDNNEILEFCEPRIEEIKKSLESQFNIKIFDHTLTFYAKRNEQVKPNHKKTIKK